MPRRRVKEVPLIAPFEQPPAQEEMENAMANLQLDELVGSAAATSAAATSAAEAEFVYLTCVKVQGKLRVRITTPGYLTTANCQFPRDLRVEGRNFRVKPSAVKLMSARNKYYYCIKNAKDIEVVQPANLPKQPPPKLKVYQDTEQEECLICYDSAKEAVFNPCGHFYTCHACSARCKTCPVCRHPVLSVIDKNELE